MKRIVAKKSKIHGMGLFLSRDVKKGGFIAHIKGTISTVKKQLKHTPEEALMNPDWVGVSMSYWIDPQIPFKYLNHSCEPSCGIKGKVGLYALRDMCAGDEVTIDYSTVEGNPHWKMKCSCGSKGCRGTVKSIAFLPVESFRHYYPFVPTAFKKFYLKYMDLKIE